MSSSNEAEEVASGIYRCGTERVNWYLVRDGDAFTVVDTGFPTHYPQLMGALEKLGATVSDVEACLLTHAHPDHIGFAERLRARDGVPVRLHLAGLQRARGGGNPPLGGFAAHLWRPAVLAYLVEVVHSKGVSVPPLTSAKPFGDGAELDVPGRPRVIHVPGHTEGEVAFYLADREALLCGDALATVNFETWRGRRPQLLPAWINADHDQARRSLARLEGIGEVTVLPGHGDPWTGPMRETLALDQARE